MTFTSRLPPGIADILVNINENFAQIREYISKYMNIYNIVIQKQLCLPPSDPKMHCEPREKFETSTYPLAAVRLRRGLRLTSYSSFNFRHLWLHVCKGQIIIDAK